MSDIKLRIMRALFQGAAISTAISTVACGSDPVESNQGWKIAEDRKQDMSMDQPVDLPSDVPVDLPVDMPPDMLDLVEVDMVEICDTNVPKLFKNLEGASEGNNRYLVCITPTALEEANLKCENITEANALHFANAIKELNTCYELGSHPDGAQLCGPVPMSNPECCYVMNLSIYSCDIPGRPFIVNGMLRTAECARREGWLIELDDRVHWRGLDALPDDIRQLVAAAWATSGCHEHASIASFSSFMMDLMQLGAPKDLIEQTTQAIADEIDHAARCFTIATAYAGHPLGPDSLDTTMPPHRTLEEVLIAAIDEGCINETCAAYQADIEALHTTSPYLKESLETIAEDETNHALLAWRFVDWVLSNHPQLIEVAQQTFHCHMLGEPSPWASGQTPEQYVLQQHGYTPDPIKDRLKRHAFVHIVQPCANALLRKHQRLQEASKISFVRGVEAT